VFLRRVSMHMDLLDDMAVSTCTQVDAIFKNDDEARRNPMYARPPRDMYLSSHRFLALYIMNVVGVLITP
jgi:hypothetical protein